MFYKNIIKTQKAKENMILYNKFQINLNSDDTDFILEKNQTKLIYNFISNNGELKTGYGLKILALPVADGSNQTREITIGANANILNLWHFQYYDELNKRPAERLFWNNSNGRIVYCTIFSYDNLSYNLSSLNELESTPVGINYSINDVDYMLFSYDNGIYKVTQNSLSTHITNLPKFVSLVTAYNRIYAIIDGKRNKITYSDTLDPTNWTINENTLNITDERGACNKLIYFNDYLYVFRDYGITKISKYTLNGTHSITNLFITPSRIYEGSVVICGDSIMFLAKDGLYSFNGSTTKKLEYNIKNMLSDANENATACFNDGKYFVACKLNFDDNTQVGCESYANGYQNNAVIIFDTLSEQISIIRGVDIHCLLSLNSGSFSKVLASFNGEYSKKIGILDKSGTVFGNTLPSFWESVVTDFDLPNKEKFISELYIKTINNCQVKIITDKTTKVFNITGKAKSQKISINLKCKEMQIVICSNGETKISALKLKVLIYE